MALPRYIPILKTSDAELRAYSHLESDVKDGVLPLFELTKSRRTKKLPEGDIYKRVSQINEQQEGRPFILDLTTFPDLINFQIENLLDPSDGFENWCEFVEDLEIDGLIPVIHGLDDDPDGDMERQIARLNADFDHLAFRADLFDPDTAAYVEKIFENIDAPQKLIFIVDASFIRQGHANTLSGTAINRIEEVLLIGEPGMIFVSGSSFPRSVTDYGDDWHDYFPLEEVEFYRLVREHFDQVDICYSDYATVHPIRYDVRGGNWVPRVDLVLDDRIIYYRFRRDDGGYIEAADEAADDANFSPLGSWGDDEILAAASGSPNGRSPAYWISVRINSHITRKVRRPI
jgi:hypothetical protein